MSGNAGKHFRFFAIGDHLWQGCICQSRRGAVIHKQSRPSSDGLWGTRKVDLSGEMLYNNT